MDYVSMIIAAIMVYLIYLNLNERPDRMLGAGTQIVPKSALPSGSTADLKPKTRPVVSHPTVIPETAETDYLYRWPVGPDVNNRGPMPRPRVPNYQTQASDVLADNKWMAETGVVTDIARHYNSGRQQMLNDQNGSLNELGRAEMNAAAENNIKNTRFYRFDLGTENTIEIGDQARSDGMAGTYQPSRPELFPTSLMYQVREARVSHPIAESQTGEQGTRLVNAECRCTSDNRLNERLPVSDDLGHTGTTPSFAVIAQGFKNDCLPAE